MGRSIEWSLDLAQEYEDLWMSMRFTGDKSTMAWYTGRINKGLAQYKQVAKATHVPWQVIAVIHMRECSGNFNEHLHNGDPLDRPTVRVPVGRPEGSGPFLWGISAIDAIEYKGWHKFKPVLWNGIPFVLYRLEQYNGMGYRMYHPETLSPYVWGQTNHHIKGKYISDGKFNANAIEKQIGTAPLLAALGLRGINRTNEIN